MYFQVNLYSEDFRAERKEKDELKREINSLKREIIEVKRKHSISKKVSLLDTGLPSTYTLQSTLYSV